MEKCKLVAVLFSYIFTTVNVKIYRSPMKCKINFEKKLDVLGIQLYQKIC